MPNLGIPPEILWPLSVALDFTLVLLLWRIFGKYGLFLALILSVLLANILAPNVTEVFGFQTSLGVILYSATFLATDMLNERYGRAAAQQAVFMGFAANIIMLIMVTLAIQYPPSARPESAEFAATMHEATQTLFGLTPKFVLGSMLAYLVSQALDVWVFDRIRRLTSGRYLWLRNNGSTMISQGVDTFLYSLVVWWGIYDLETALQLGLFKYVAKMFLAGLDTVFIYLWRFWSSRSEPTYA